jgi:hypothetical protein
MRFAPPAVLRPPGFRFERDGVSFEAVQVVPHDRARYRCVTAMNHHEHSEGLGTASAARGAAPPRERTDPPTVSLSHKAREIRRRQFAIVITEAECWIAACPEHQEPSRLPRQQGAGGCPVHRHSERALRPTREPVAEPLFDQKRRHTGGRCRALSPMGVRPATSDGSAIGVARA